MATWTVHEHVVASWTMQETRDVSWVVHRGSLEVTGGGGAPTGGAGGALSGTYPNPGLNEEVVQDLVGAMATAGAGITYDDTAGSLSVAESVTAAIDAGARVWTARMLIVGPTAEQLTAAIGWGQVQSGRYADSGGIKDVVTGDPGTITAAVPNVQTGDLLLAATSFTPPSTFVADPAWYEWSGTAWVAKDIGFTATVATVAAELALLDGARVASAELARSEWDQITHPLLVTNPTPAAMDLAAGVAGAWQITTGDARGTFRHTPAGLDLELFAEILPPFGDDQLDPSLAWPSLSFAELLTLVRPSIANDWWEAAAWGTPGNMALLGRWVWFVENTRIGGTIEDPHTAVADDGRAFGGPRRIRISQQCASDPDAPDAVGTVTFYDWVTHDTGEPGVVQSPTGRWWRPFFSDTHAAWASIADPEAELVPANPAEGFTEGDPEVIVPWYVGIRARMRVAELFIHEFGDNTALVALDEAALTAAGVGVTEVECSAGTTLTTVAGTTVAGPAVPAGTPTVDVVSNVATGRLLGRTSADTGDSEELTPAQARDLLDIGLRRITNQTLASDQASITVDVTGLWLVQIIFFGRSTLNSGQDTLVATLNGNTGNLYSTDTGTLTSRLSLGSVPGALTNTDRYGFVRTELGIVENVMKAGVGSATNIASTASQGQALVNRGQFSTITAAATSIELFMANAGSNIAAGSRILVLGA